MNKKRQHLLSLLIPVTIFGAIIVTLFSLSQNLDIRNRASSDSSDPSITLRVEPETPTKNQPVTLTFLINTKNKVISGIQLQNFLIVPDPGIEFTATPTLETIAVPGLLEFQKTILQNSPTNDQITAVTHISILASPATGYTSNNQDVPFAKVTFIPNDIGKISFNFTTANTKVTEFGGTAGNILIPPSNGSIIIQEQPTATATVTTTVTATVTVTATAAPTTKSCNQSCSSNSDCQNGLYCNNGSCRNGSCSDETDCDCSTPAVTYKTCNQSCNSHSDCKAGYFCTSAKVCRDAKCPEQMNCDCIVGSNTGGTVATKAPTRKVTAKSNPTTVVTEEPEEELTSTPEITETLTPTSEPEATPSVASNRTPLQAIAIFLIPALIIIFVVTGLFLFRKREQ